MAHALYWNSAKKNAHNEQIKLSATFLNNVSVAIIVVSVITPIVTFVAERPLPLVLAGACAGALLGLVLHIVARCSLDLMQE